MAKTYADRIRSWPTDADGWHVCPRGKDKGKHYKIGDTCQIPDGAELGDGFTAGDGFHQLCEKDAQTKAAIAAAKGRTA